MSVWSEIKKVFSGTGKDVELGEEYVELETDVKEAKAKVLIKPYTLTKFDDIKDVLTGVREGHTISLLNIGPLKEKDITELKRAIDKIKKTVEATDGDIAGFGENFLVVTPSFAKVQRPAIQSAPRPEATEEAKAEEI
jgi:SepF-like predicted cell division protein (DUF552 family)